MVAAILATGLAANQRTSPTDVVEAVRVYHACLEALRHYADVPAEARWSAAGELRRLTEQDAQKTR